jgi:hypothetical protein
MEKQNNIQDARYSTIQYYLEVLAEHCLDFDIHTQEKLEIPKMFSEVDVINATIIFNCVLGNRACHEMLKQNLKLEFGEELAHGFGVRIKELVKAMSGIDTTKI